MSVRGPYRWHNLQFQLQLGTDTYPTGDRHSDFLIVRFPSRYDSSLRRLRNGDEKDAQTGPPRGRTSMVRVARSAQYRCGPIPPKSSGAGFGNIHERLRNRYFLVGPAFRSHASASPNG
jgi:hypothetical protein